MNRLRSCLIPLFLLSLATTVHGQAASAPDLVGLWHAKSRFGPDVAGRLVIDRSVGGWRASIAGRTAEVRVASDSVSFRLPDGSRAFSGRVKGGRLVGSWMQPRTVSDGFPYASAAVLESCGANCFAGTIVPRADEFTFFLDVQRRVDGTLGVLLRNPERNLARFIRAERMEADSASARLLDRTGAVRSEGVIRDDVMTVYFGNRGGSYDFRRVPEDAFTFFYPRGRPTASYT